MKKTVPPTYKLTVKIKTQKNSKGWLTSFSFFVVFWLTQDQFICRWADTQVYKVLS